MIVAVICDSTESGRKHTLNLVPRGRQVVVLGMASDDLMAFSEGAPPVVHFEGGVRSDDVGSVLSKLVEATASESPARRSERYSRRRYL